MKDFSEQQFVEYLYGDIDLEKAFPIMRPLLAHYGSLDTIEKILKHEELWLSHPLQMNDVEEVSSGINAAMNLLRSNGKFLETLGTDDRRELFFSSLDRLYSDYATDGVLDLYVICFSEHLQDNHDGNLVMWRGYGGEGSGAALILDTSRIEPLDQQALILDRVSYETRESRLDKIEIQIERICSFLNEYTVPILDIQMLAKHIFERILIAAVYTKNRCFEDEKEWRLVYFSQRDKSDFFKTQFSYDIGPQGVHPRLKLNFEEYSEFRGKEIKIADLLDSIILGPSNSAPVVGMAAARMLDQLNLSHLKSRLFVSTIPYRKR